MAVGGVRVLVPDGDRNRREKGLNRKTVSGQRVEVDLRALPTVGGGGLGGKGGTQSLLLVIPKVSRTKVLPCHLELEVSGRTRRAGSPVIQPF